MALTISNIFISALTIYTVIQVVRCVDIIDMTHKLNPDTLTWPWNPPFNFTILHRGPWGKIPWIENNYIATPEHMGTHMDAPAHFKKGAWRIADIPIENLMGPGVIINVKDKVKVNSRYVVQIEDLKTYEDKYGKIPKGAVVVMNSGWAAKWPNKRLAFGSTTFEDFSTFHFPGWGEEATSWLVNERMVNIIGTDCPSIDVGNSLTSPSHRVAAAKNVLLLENVANLDNVTESGSKIYCVVIKIDNGSGGPMRMFAVVGDIGVGLRTSCLLLAIMLILLYFL